MGRNNFDDQWREWFSATPPGHTIAELATRAGKSYSNMANLARRFGYSGRRAEWPKKNIAWHRNADWSLLDTDIARQYGVTRERVRQVRQSRGLPPSRGQGLNNTRFHTDMLRDWVSKNQHRIHEMTIREIIEETKTTACKDTVRKIVGQCKRSTERKGCRTGIKLNGAVIRDRRRQLGLHEWECQEASIGTRGQAIWSQFERHGHQIAHGRCHGVEWSTADKVAKVLRLGVEEIIVRIDVDKRPQS